MTTKAREHFILFATVSYIILALAWIFLSDQLLAVFSTDNASVVWLSTAKGVFFVAATAALLYFALRAVPPAAHAESIRSRDADPDGAPPARRPNWLIYVFAVAVIVALVVGLVRVALWQGEIHNRERATVATQNVALLLDRELSGRFDRIDLALQSVTNFYRTQTAEQRFEPAKFDAHVRQMHVLLPDVTDLRVLDKDGFVRYGAEIPKGAPVNNADRAYFMRARASGAEGIIVDGPFIARIRQETVVVLARRLNAPDGSFAGVVYASVTAASFGELLSSLDLGPHGAATIRTADLALVQRFPAVKNTVGSRVVSTDLAEIIQLHPSGGSYVAATRIDGIERSNAYRKLSHYPFYVIVGLAGVDYQGAWKNEALLLSVLAALAILATILAAGLVYRTYQRHAADLEERRRIDEELKTLLAERTALNAELAVRADEAEAANRAKSAFVANMSHEIRTPMNAILGLAYLLEKKTLPGDASEMVRNIRMAGRLLLGIINDILDFSKIDSGKLQIEVAPFRLSDVLDSLATIMSANACDKELELIIAPPPPRTNQVRGDALRLEQVLINLTGNAIKFTERGHVALSISVVGEDDDQVTLRFSVRDTGIGIPPERQEEIFASFAQIDGSTSRRFGGTGLGLTISRRLVACMGGQLQLTSVPGSGSEFWFVLSFGRGRDAWVAAPEMAHLGVLIVDDDSIAREALRTMVDGLGWRATALGSGEAAVQYIQTKPETHAPTEVLLLDYRMPGMDGLATARTIRHQLKATANPIVIMVTAFSSRNLLEHPDSELADAVLNKPVTPSGLYNAVARAMRVRQGGEERAASPSEQRLYGLRILVVDDSEINREVAQRILVGEGATVILASDGQQAVDWLRQNPDQADLVLMDVQMPVMNGYEATRQLRRIPALAELPVIALTAGAFMEQQELANEAGMNSFIAKPFDVDAAIALIIKLAGRAARVPRTTRPETNPSGPAVAPDLPGLAIDKGIRTWRRPAAYRQFLRRFADDYADSAQVIAGADHAAASALAHKLKGAAGALAIDAVAELAGEIDDALRAGQDPAASIAGLQTALDTALASIELYAPSASPTEKPPTD